MKYILTVFLLSGLSAFAQSETTTTNNVKVVLTDAQVASLRYEWRSWQAADTNNVATFNQWLDLKATEVMQNAAANTGWASEARMKRLWDTADEAKRLQAIQALR